MSKKTLQNTNEDLKYFPKTKRTLLFLNSPNVPIVDDGNTADPQRLATGQSLTQGVPLPLAGQQELTH